SSPHSDRTPRRVFAEQPPPDTALFPRPGFFHGDKRHSLLEGKCGGVGALRQGGVDFAIFYVRAVAPGTNDDLAPVWTLAKRARGSARRIAKTPPRQAAFLSDDEINRPVCAYA